MIRRNSPDGGHEFRSWLAVNSVRADGVTAWQVIGKSHEH
jgi:hypothetical protein